MQIPTVEELIPILQTAIGPVILISGVGLLLLTMTNRLGRIIDRARLLAVEYPQLSPSERERKAAQLAILWRRARLIRLAIILVAASSLFAAILIVILFLTALFRLEAAVAIGVCFILCMLALIGGLLVFIHDLNQSLTALKLEIEDTRSAENMISHR